MSAYTVYIDSVSSDDVDQSVFVIGRIVADDVPDEEFCYSYQTGPGEYADLTWDSKDADETRIRRQDAYTDLFGSLIAEHIGQRRTQDKVLKALHERLIFEAKTKIGTRLQIGVVADTEEGTD